MALPGQLKFVNLMDKPIMTMPLKTFIKCCFILLLIGCSPDFNITSPFQRSTEKLEKSAMNRLEEASMLFPDWKHVGVIAVDSVKVQRHNKQATLYFSPATTHIPIRYPLLAETENELKQMMGRRFRKYQLTMMARGRNLYEYIPNYYRHDYLAPDTSRVRVSDNLIQPLTKRISPVQFTNGLYGNHIAIWNSHGRYYNAAKDRWQWQRARLFSTVEDIFPTQYVLNYITPMLENAGANVLLPRERDLQSNQVIVDNDSSDSLSELIIHHGNGTWKTTEGGFAKKDTLYDGENPFKMGSYLSAETNRGASLVYLPNIPESGNYAVYFSWSKTEGNIAEVPVTVNYAGGSSTITVNQQMGHGTWIYLGTFWFNQGKNAAEGSLTVHTHSAFEGTVTADAVRFGGGMGNVARRPAPRILPNQLSATDNGRNTNKSELLVLEPEIDWKTSGSPRFAEGARYYLQFAGMPDTLVYSFNEGKNDYNDDYMSRGEWVNYLLGAPLGPQNNRSASGLNIPVDLSLAFHTDAGITPGDSVIGTLAIYSADRDNGIFPDSISRMASRDLSDIVQEQIVNDIRNLYNPEWTRRSLWDRQYSEAWRPNAPALLLELLSHQNLADMRYGLDPRFQFDVSRAIYKGILRFISWQETREAVIQPLPPGKMKMERTGASTIRLSWAPTPDPLEPSAMPQAYVVYTREEQKAFDQGILVSNTYIDIELPRPGTIYSFRVTGINSGGESFPSEILSAALRTADDDVVLIVNGFQKISGPGVTADGLNNYDDHLIPHQLSVGFTGLQYDYDRMSPWLDDDSPGWGASYADYEGKILAGNTFDFPYIHGQSIRNAGYSFISVSREAFEKETTDTKKFFAIDFIMGKQKGTPGFLGADSTHYRVFTPMMMEKLESYAWGGGNIIITGSYIGTDNVLSKDTTAIDFTSRVLGYTWRTRRATNEGIASVTDAWSEVFIPRLVFITQPNALQYHVEAPDAIEAAGIGSRTVYRYTAGGSSAAVIHHSGHKVFAMGFPFETISSATQRDELMKRILVFFKEKTNKN